MPSARKPYPKLRRSPIKSSLDPVKVRRAMHSGHVLPEAGAWKVVQIAGSWSGIFNDKNEALMQAAKLSRSKRSGVVYVHDAEGKVEEKAVKLLLKGAH